MNLPPAACIRCGSPLDEKLHCAGTALLGSCGWTMPAWMMRDEISALLSTVEGDAADLIREALGTE